MGKLLSSFQVKESIRHELYPFINLVHGQVCWKSSSLAPLCHGMDGWGPKELEQRGGQAMDKQELNMWVQFSEDNKGRIVLKMSYST